MRRWNVLMECLDGVSSSAFWGAYRYSLKGPEEALVPIWYPLESVRLSSLILKLNVSLFSVGSGGSERGSDGGGGRGSGSGIGGGRSSRGSGSSSISLLSTGGSLAGAGGGAVDGGGVVAGVWQTPVPGRTPRRRRHSSAKRSMVRTSEGLLGWVLESGMAFLLLGQSVGKQPCGPYAQMICLPSRMSPPLFFENKHTASSHTSPWTPPPVARRRSAAPWTRSLKWRTRDTLMSTGGQDAHVTSSLCTMTSCNPFDMMTSCNPFDMMTSCNPFDMMTSCNPFDMMTSCNPFDMMTSATCLFCAPVVWPCH